MVIWILGMSGSGKTTLAKMILKKSRKKIIHIDGDSIREIYEKKLGYTIEDREINAQRISKLTKYLSDQKIPIIVSVLSNFPKWLNWNRKNLTNYYEIYLKNDLKTLKLRKPNLYSDKSKNVIGLDIKFNEPKNPYLIIKNCNNLKKLNYFSKKISNLIK